MVAALRHRCIRLIRVSIEDLLLADLPVGGVKEIADYFKLFDYDINLIVEAIKKSGVK